MTNKLTEIKKEYNQLILLLKKEGLKLISFNDLKDRYKYETDCTVGILLIIRKADMVYELQMSTGSFKQIDFMVEHITHRINTLYREPSCIHKWQINSN
ncbi:MAG: hypothetical protein IIC76_13965 [Bacteroidetes bacterium]|nr:hypothetical protein [Bacteroidota bacterium]